MSKLCYSQKIQKLTGLKTEYQYIDIRISPFELKPRICFVNYVKSSIAISLKNKINFKSQK